jgi:hypothetical protein
MTPNAVPAGAWAANPPTAGATGSLRIIVNGNADAAATAATRDQNAVRQRIASFAYV